MESQIKIAVDDYNRAKAALKRLGVSDLEFNDITEADLKMPGDIIEENRIGQRSDQLPWFWRLDGQLQGDELNPRMKECKYS